ncbi:MarR family transcriptional regulator [Methylocella sp. CPCC 101449]|jgi:DNA-binding MarR family transcriptional regulator|uniref:MarR family winged helix-turn-helix transcriptional regulator n=1 Tax=Methylocella sp. CPCC 101449 TaxID=2987531 RepID=UPI0028906E6C|nr:MarR family transcriptional regulator [Methylocella sp. CPCC 101449]MDT2022426.1 MarR family transcriptional regulator [Methylocella sp. CPCC 101449]HEV2572845.1 MarR family transcriptional regulator [Beijerinckiaceae bacterium]
MRAETIQAIGTAMELFQEATDAFDDTAAAALGLNRTDLKCVNIIVRHGPVAAGDVAKLTGLTRGAMTTALDRIERAGYARRKPDPADRRGVLMELTEKGREALDAIWGVYIREADQFFADYSVAELQTIHRFLEQGRQVQDANRERVSKLRFEA